MIHGNDSFFGNGHCPKCGGAISPMLDPEAPCPNCGCDLSNEIIMFPVTMFEPEAVQAPSFSFINFHTFLFAMFSAEKESDPELFSKAIEKIDSIGAEETYLQLKHIVEVDPLYDSKDIRVIAEYILQ